MLKLLLRPRSHRAINSCLDNPSEYKEQEASQSTPRNEGLLNSHGMFGCSLGGEERNAVLKRCISYSNGHFIKLHFSVFCKHSLRMNLLSEPLCFIPSLNIVF